MIDTQYNAKIAFHRAADEAKSGNSLTPSSSAPREAIVRSIADQLNERCKHLHLEVSRLTAVSDRLFGVKPEGDKGSQMGRAPTCDIENLGASVPFLDYLIGQLAKQADRLEQL